MGDERAERMSAFSQKTRKKTRKPWRGAASALAILIAAAALSPPASAEESWLDSINPLNLFKGEKYEPKVVPDVPADDLYNQALARLQSKDYDGAAKKFAELKSNIPIRNGKEKRF